MQKAGETNPLSLIQGSTSNLRQEGGENKSSQSQEYIDVDAKENFNKKK
jgi:hypothetical protein